MNEPHWITGVLLTRYFDKAWYFAHYDAGPYNCPFDARTDAGQVWFDKDARDQIAKDMELEEHNEDRAWYVDPPEYPYAVMRDLKLRMADVLCTWLEETGLEKEFRGLDEFKP